jgi:hypothetical protein
MIADCVRSMTSMIGSVWDLDPDFQVAKESRALRREDKTIVDGMMSKRLRPHCVLSQNARCSMDAARWHHNGLDTERN